MAGRAVTALFDSYEDAARIVDRIEAEGVPQSEIGIVSLDATDRPNAAGEPGPVARPAEAEAADGAGAGATVGTVLGGGAGLLAGLGLIAIPGVGPIVAAGWLITALSGAGVGAAAGGLIGALTGAGLSGKDAETYAEGLRRGGTLVTVRADGDLAERVVALMRRGGAVDLDERAEGWRLQGWTGSPAAPVATATPAPEPEPALAPAPDNPADPTLAPPTRRPPGAIG
ncbi:hypothetical protein [Methylorubrum sp. POS3]|uniref:hypothetical protein n=1 Tax=Methylorubrum sp. POS3 TaxID=2998492 RepID=UPI00372923B3